MARMRLNVSPNKFASDTPRKANVKRKTSQLHGNDLKWFICSHFFFFVPLKMLTDYYVKAHFDEAKLLAQCLNNCCCESMKMHFHSTCNSIWLIVLIFCFPPIFIFAFIFLFFGGFFSFSLCTI